MQEMQVQSLGPEDPLEKGMATHSSILAWRIAWTEESGGLPSMGSHRVGHDIVTTQARWPHPHISKRKSSHVFCLTLGLRGEVLGVCALRLVVNLVALAVLGMTFLDDIHLGVDGVEFGDGHPVCAGDSLVLCAPHAVVHLKCFQYLPHKEPI